MNIQVVVTTLFKHMVLARTIAVAAGSYRNERELLQVLK